MDEFDDSRMDGGFEYCLVEQTPDGVKISLNLEAGGGVPSRGALRVKRNVLIGGRFRQENNGWWV